MAGSYKHCVDVDGNLLDNRRLADILENGGDVYEAIEQLYGMVWWLAGRLPDTRHPQTRAVIEVENARANYIEGLAIARRVNGPLDA